MCRTLFLTKLHDKDLWGIWVLLHPKPSGDGAGGGGGKGSGGGGGGGGGAGVLGTERPLEAEQVRHLLALLSEANKNEQVDSLLEKVDADGSGAIEFEELATLIRAVNPQRTQARELADIEVDAHPLLHQVQALDDRASWGIMYATAEHLEAASRRAGKLAAIVSRLDGTAEIGGGGNRRQGGGRNASAGGGAGNSVDRATLAMIHEVAAEQLAAAAEGERRGSLKTYCSDAHAEALARFGQALRHAADLLEAHGYDTYESHVALRTVRTVEHAERLHPGRRVEWRMEGAVDGKGLVWADQGEEEASESSSSTMMDEAGVERRRLCLSYQEGGGIRTGSRPSRDDYAAFAAAAAAHRSQGSPGSQGLPGGSPGGSPSALTRSPTKPRAPWGAGSMRKRSAMDQSMRQRAAAIYASGRDVAPYAVTSADIAAAAKSGAKDAEQKARALAEDADEVAKEAMGLLSKADPRKEKESAAGAAHRRRSEMLTGGSSSAKVADAMADEDPEALRLAAKVHQRVLRSKDTASRLRGIILGAQ